MYVGTHCMCKLALFFSPPFSPLHTRTIHNYIQVLSEERKKVLIVRNGIHGTPTWYVMT